LRVNSTQSLILTAPADRLGARVGGASESQRSSPPLGTEPLDVSWTDVEVSDVFPGDASQNAGFAVQQASRGISARAWSPAQQYARLAAVDSHAKGIYLDVHA
jgi:hypothetical protein